MVKELEFYSIYEKSLFNSDKIHVATLDYVRLKSNAVKEIGQFYQIDPRYANYSLQIDSVEIGYESEYDRSKKINDYIRELPKNKIVGVVGFTKISDNIEHAFPFIVANLDGRKIFVAFENMDKSMALAEVKNENHKFVANYPFMQKDGNSCTIFSLNTLKNCLTNTEFLREIRGNSTELTLPKTVMSQNARDMQSLPQEKRDLYLKQFAELDNKTQNMKAFYKGHFYALMLNPQHLDLLNDYSRQLYLEIDQRRKDAKLGQDELEHDEGSDFENYEPDLPDNSLGSVSSRRVFLEGVKERKS